MIKAAHLEPVGLDGKKPAECLQDYLGYVDLLSKPLLDWLGDWSRLSLN